MCRNWRAHNLLDPHVEHWISIGSCTPFTAGTPCVCDPASPLQTQQSPLPPRQVLPHREHRPAQQTRGSGCEAAAAARLRATGHEDERPVSVNKQVCFHHEKCYAVGTSCRRKRTEPPQTPAQTPAQTPELKRLQKRTSSPVSRTRLSTSAGAAASHLVKKFLT